MSKESSTALAAIAGAAIGAAATISVGALGFFNKNRDLDIKMIEISLGILREDPEESNIKAAREWAVDLLDFYSGQPLSSAARLELIDRPLDIEVRSALAPVTSSLEKLRDFIEARRRADPLSIEPSSPPPDFLYDTPPIPRVKPNK